MTKFLMFLFVNVLAITSLTINANSMALNGEFPNIEVKGQGSVLAEPDLFSLTIAIIERGKVTSKLRATVDDKSNQVVLLAKSLGLYNNDINSARVTLTVIEKKPSITLDAVEVKQRSEKGYFSKQQSGNVYVNPNGSIRQNNIKPQYFELSRTITVNFSSIDDYDHFLNKVIKLGVSHIYPLAMSVKDTEKYYQQALIQALKNAKNKALKIASHSNVDLGKLLYVTEQSSNYYRSRSVRTSELSSNHSSQVGNQAINASVLVKYLIKE